MKKMHAVLKEINDLTYKIEHDYPELYKYLDENPVTLPTMNHPSMNTDTFANYLETLKDLLQHHLDTHKKK
jgi:hypothetical protein